MSFFSFFFNPIRAKYSKRVENIFLSSDRTQRCEERVVLRFRGLEQPPGLVRQRQIGAESHVDLQVYATRARDQIADAAHRAGARGVAKANCHQ